METSNSTSSQDPVAAKLSLPLIDISPFLTHDASAAAVSQTTAALRTALLEHGFFYVVQHGVDAAFLADVIAHARHFFTAAPAAEKRRLKRRSPTRTKGANGANGTSKVKGSTEGSRSSIADGARGYQVIGENVTVGHRDWHEALDWYRPICEGEGVLADEIELVGNKTGGEGHEVDNDDDDDNDDEQIAVVRTSPLTSSGTNGASTGHRERAPPFALLEGPNLWPSTPSTFRAVYEAYVNKMRHLGTAILHAMGAALALDDRATFADAARDSFWVMRAIGYPPLAPELAAEGGVSCGEHSDYGCLTLLLADDTPGALQVRDQTTGAWKAVTPVADALVVNVGDMVELWTAGLVRSTKHRVVHTGTNYRVSVPFFLEPGKDVVVQPLPECVEEVKALGRTPLTGKVRYWDHLVGKVGGNFYQPVQNGA